VQKYCPAGQGTYYNMAHADRVKPRYLRTINVPTDNLSNKRRLLSGRGTSSMHLQLRDDLQELRGEMWEPQLGTRIVKTRR